MALERSMLILTMMMMVTKVTEVTMMMKKMLCPADKEMCLVTERVEL